MSRLQAGLAVSIGLCVSLLGIAGSARAEDDCPLGSTQKTESGQTWCEPSVCDTDTNCPTGLICRPVPLCVEVGVLDPKTDAGQKLLVRQRCGAGKACPQNTTCSEKSRCITRVQADKAGLTTAGAASAAPASSAGAGDPPKKACGCSVPGAEGGGALGGVALAMLGVLAIGARRRSRQAAPDA